MCVSYFTLRIIIILMEIIKDLYKRLLDPIRAATVTTAFALATRADNAKQPPSAQQRAAL
jgi:hypothetical protein